MNDQLGDGSYVGKLHRSNPPIFTGLLPPEPEKSKLRWPKQLLKYQAVCGGREVNMCRGREVKEITHAQREQPLCASNPNCDERDI